MLPLVSMVMPIGFDPVVPSMVETPSGVILETLFELAFVV